MPIGWTMMALQDKFGRPITDLRISITDHCNYKCVYCRTGNEGALYRDLPFSDYLRMARIFAGLGIKKVRLTGGEPLLRKGIIDFVRDLSKSGCGLWSRVRFDSGTQLVLHFPASNGQPPLARVATVCHSRGQDGAGYAVGCRFTGEAKAS